jgi:hypothetical protein
MLKRQDILADIDASMDASNKQPGLRGHDSIGSATRANAKAHRFHTCRGAWLIFGTECGTHRLMMIGNQLRIPGEDSRLPAAMERQMHWL